MQTLKTDPTKEIQASARDFARRINERNVDAIVAYYTKDALVKNSGAPPAVGTKAIRALAEELIDVFSDVRIKPGAVHTSGDLAVTTGAYPATVALPGGGSAEDRGTYVEAWRRGADGTWSCFLDSFSSDLPNA
jgi:ketosteroid isomerase-like protein